jgi:hypothetical protein
MDEKKTITQHAADHLREIGKTGIMWGDVCLAHEIATRAGMKHEGWRTPPKILRALEGSPLFKKSLERVRVDGRYRLVRCFDLMSPV